MVKRYTVGGPLNIPFYSSVVTGTPCHHAHLTRTEARACEAKRKLHRAPVILITRARARREGGRR